MAIIRTFLAEKGDKYDETGQCISSYERSIVFLPRDAQPGELVRCRLIPITEKKDRNGRTMHRAEYAPPPLFAEHEEAIAEEARMLRRCIAFPHKQGAALLRARFGEDIVVAADHEWLYFKDDDAVYGSRFSPEVLAIFEEIGSASHSGLVNLLGWLLSESFYRKFLSGAEICRDDVPQISDEQTAGLAEKAEKGEHILSKELLLQKL